MTLLYVHALTVADASGHRLLDGLSLHLDPGQVLGLAGGAGAGKTLLATILSGAPPRNLEIIGGRVLFGDRDLLQENGDPAAETPVAIYDQGAATRAPRRKKDSGAIVIDRDPTALAEICDEIAVLCAGRLVERAAARDLIAAPRHPYTQALLDRTGPENDLGPVRAGCPFYTACPRSDPACLQADMRLQMISDDHASACARWRAIWPLVSADAKKSDWR